MKRLVESGTEFERGLLESLTLERPSAELEQRMRGALGLDPVPGPAPTTPAAPAAKAALGGWGSIAAGAVVAALIGGGVLLGRTPTGEAPETSAPPPARAAEPSAPIAAPEAEMEGTRVPVTEAEQSVPPRTAPVPASRQRSSVTTPSLREEIELIDAARVAVKDGDVARVTALLGQYERRFPQGAFTAEARILRKRAAELREAGKASKED